MTPLRVLRSARACCSSSRARSEGKEIVFFTALVAMPLWYEKFLLGSSLFVRLILPRRCPSLSHRGCHAAPPPLFSEFFVGVLREQGGARGAVDAAFGVVALGGRPLEDLAIEGFTVGFRSHPQLDAGRDQRP